jgi:hypothetical protein
MMSDFKIASDGTQWDLVLDDGDLVLLDDLDADDYPTTVAQRIVYRVMTWSGESPYDRSAGLPHDQILGSLEPVEGVAGIYALEIQETEGVEDVVSFDFQEPRPTNDATLELQATVRVRGRPLVVGLVLG